MRRIGTQNTREPVATNYLTLVQTNLVPVVFTNLVRPGPCSKPRPRARKPMRSW